jgi:hypothetical protein
VFNVKFFKKSKSSDNFINMLTTKKYKGIPAPKVSEFFDVLKMHDEQKHIPLPVSNLNKSKSSSA